MPAVTFPLWFISDPASTTPSLLSITGPNGEIAYPLFSDGDSARRFRSYRPELTGHGFSCLGDWNGLYAVLDLVEKHGVTHVVIDPQEDRNKFDSIQAIRTV